MSASLWDRPRAEWVAALEAYPGRLQYKDTKKSPGRLAELEAKVREAMPAAVAGRAPAHMLHAELQDLMRWKLARGKMRPLQRFIDALEPQSVVTATQEAFRLLAAGKVERALAAVQVLKGVGPATASGILALASDDVPYMSDPLLEAVPTDPAGQKRREYTTPRFVEVLHFARSKSAELNLSIKEMEMALYSDWLWTTKAPQAVRNAARKRALEELEEGTASGVDDDEEEGAAGTAPEAEVEPAAKRRRG